MRKVNIVLLILLICLICGSSYYIFFYDKDKLPDYTYYNEAYNKLKNTETYETFDDISIIAEKKKHSNNGYGILVLFYDAKYNMNDVDILIIDKNEITNPTDAVYPSSGLIGEEAVSFTPGDQVSSTIRNKYTMGFDSKNDVTSLLIYFSFTNDKSERIEKYIEVGVK